MFHCMFLPSILYKLPGPYIIYPIPRQHLLSSHPISLLFTIWREKIRWVRYRTSSILTTYLKSSNPATIGVSTEKSAPSSSMSKILSSMYKIKHTIAGAAEKATKIGKEDPRRIYHSLKVALALTLVSVVYYVNPIFNGFGVNAMWAVITVVVVMDYTVGGTLGKGLNRTFATMVAGALGLGANHLAVLAGEKGEPIVLGAVVFLLAAAATFTRFVPEVKRRYDYGVTIFILTFSLVAVSSYRTEEVFQMAQQRLSTIAIGVASCVCTSVFILPVWAGEDLHKQAGTNLDKIASFLEGLVANYFGEKVEKKPFLGAYKGVLNSKAAEEALANFAKWEPGHGRFSYRHPWSQYLKIGALARQCAYPMDALAAYIDTSPKTHDTKSESRAAEIQEASKNMALESSKALSELAASIRTMTPPTSVMAHLAVATAAAEKARAALLEGCAAVGPEILRAATVASILIQVVDCVEQTSAAVEELARLAKFKASSPAEVVARNATVNPVAEVECPQVVIAVKPDGEIMECPHDPQAPHQVVI